MIGWSPKANEVGEGLFCRTWNAWRQRILDTTILFNYEHSLVYNSWQENHIEWKKKYRYCRRYYLEHCIKSYHYAVTYHLQFRKDAIYYLRKLRLSLLGNRLKDLIQDWHKAMSVSHRLILLILSFHNSKITSVIFGVVICHGRTRKAKLVQIRTQILLMKLPQTH